MSLQHQYTKVGGLSAVSFLRIMLLSAQVKLMVSPCIFLLPLRAPVTLRTCEEDTRQCTAMFRVMWSLTR